MRPTLKSQLLYGVSNKPREAQGIALMLALLHSSVLENSPISPQACILGCPKHITCTVPPSLYWVGT